MLDDDTSTTPSTETTPAEAEPAPRRTRRRAASRPAGPPASESAPTSEAATPAPEAPAPETAASETAASEAASGAGRRTTTTKKAATKKAATKKAAAKKSTGRAGKKAAGADQAAPDETATVAEASAAPSQTPAEPTTTTEQAASGAAGAFAPLFQAPEITTPPPRRSARDAGEDREAEAEQSQAEETSTTEAGAAEESGTGTSRRRRSRGGRNRRKSGGEGESEQGQPAEEGAAVAGEPETGEPKAKAGKAAGGKTAGGKTAGGKAAGGKAASGKAAGGKGGEQAKREDETAEQATTSSRRRRRRSRGGEESGEGAEAKESKGGEKSDKESITGVQGSTRIEAKKQRRREGREAGRRRAPILSESEFLARRESVDRVMAIRQRGDKTQIAVLEDNVLVEHYVALESQASLIGNVYLGRVQNVLPSMEAAFVDIGRGRNAVLYAGEVDWTLAADKNAPRRIENALKPGQTVLVQVTKDPVGHKGARLTAQISLPGRYLVYVPGGGTSGISRKLPDTERTRLKTLLKEILPEDAGVIIRTAAEGASEEALTRDVNRLTARWEDIDKKSRSGQAPSLLYAEPDTTLKVVRDLFTEDFSTLLISGDDAWDMVNGYVQHVAPDLADRLERYDGGDLFSDRRIDEQIAKALERKVWLPSGGSLVIDRTEAMTVIDVNTGKFTGAGGNLEETVTKNNLEAAEEIVRQLRLRDIGGIIVVDFIDMVLESNRDLVLRRLVECLGRDRTRHQVAEVTSLGLVQMTRKRISTGLLEAFSHTCEHCQGRGVIVESEPIEPKQQAEENGSKRGSSTRRSSSRRRGGRSGGDSDSDTAAKTDEDSAGSAKTDEGSDSPAKTDEDSAGSAKTDEGSDTAAKTDGDSDSPAKTDAAAGADSVGADQPQAESEREQVPVGD